MKTHLRVFRWHITSGLSLHMVILASVVCIGVVPHQTWADDECSSMSLPQTEMVYLPAPPELPQRIQFTVTVDVSDCTVNNDPKLRITLFDCDSSELAQQTRTLPVGCAPIQTLSIYEFSIVCGRFPNTYRIDRFFGCGSGTWVNGPAYPVPVPDFQCPAEGTDLQTFMNDLECYACSSTGAIAANDLKFYKSKRGGIYTLYALPECLSACRVGDNEPKYGETVNGGFIAPADGLLFVRTEGANDVIDMYGSVSANAPGWQQPPNQRNGQLVDPDQCITLSNGQSYQFNIRAAKGTPPANLKITFNWYWWDAVNCCLQNDMRELNIVGQEMRLDTVDPLLPQRATVTRSQGEDTELRIPDCGTKDNPGNLTQWFVMWPTNDGQIIQEGHAKGWKLVGDKLISPGPDGEEFEFSD